MSAHIPTRTLKASSTSVIVEMAFDVNAILTQMKTSASARHYSRYGNIFEPNCVGYNDKEHDNYEFLRLKNECREGGLHWITPDKVFVPYNEDLMIECINKGIEYIITNMERLSSYESRDWVDTIGNKAFQFYCDSEYYKTRYMEVSVSWSAKCKELFKEPEIIARCEKAEASLHRTTGQMDDAIRQIDNLLASLPKSATQKLRSDIESIKYTLRH